VGKVFKALHKSLADEQDLENAQGETAAGLTRRAEQNQKVEGRKGAIGSDVSTRQPVSSRTPLRESLTGIDGWDEKLVVFSFPSTPLAENFRLLRTQILHPGSGKAYKKILITSIAPGSGKSFVCANLGISIAQGLDQHALMVDCDLRRSRLASLFNCQASRGVVDYLQDGEDLGRLIVNTGMRKLSVLPSGLRPINPAELLGSMKVEKMLTELENRYDDRFILIDTPPVLVASETAVLAKHADGIILVVRWGIGGRASIKQLVESIGNDKIIGVVFNAYESNMLSAKMSGYDEYSHYAGSYGD